MSQSDEIYLGAKTFFYSLIFFLIFVIAPIIYWLDPVFKYWIDIQIEIIKADWQLSFVFTLFIILTIGHLLLEGAAIAILGAFLKIRWGMENRWVKVLRFWLSVFLIQIIVFSMIFDLKDDIVLITGLSIGLTTILCFFEWKAQIFTKAKLLEESNTKFGEYIEFDANAWMKLFVSMGILIIFLVIYFRNIGGFGDWFDDLIVLFKTNKFIFACFIILLIITVFWGILELLFLGIPIICSYLLKDVVSKKLYHTKIFCMILIVSILIFKNLPFIPLDDNIKFTISVIVVVMIEVLRWRLRMPRM